MATNTMAPLMDSSQDYIDRLNLMLERANNDLNEASRKAEGFQKNFDDAEIWRATLDKYLEEILKTFNLAQEAKNHLVTMKTNANSVGENLKWMLFSIEKLCQFVQETAVEADDLRKVDKRLMDEIACLNIPILTTNPTRSKGSLLNKLEDLQTKIGESLNAWLSAITAVLNVVKYADKLLVMVVGANKVGDLEPVNGIVMDIQEMIDLLLKGTKSYWKPLEWEFPDAELSDTTTGPECVITIPCLMVDQEIDTAALSGISSNPPGKPKSTNGMCKSLYFMDLCAKLAHAKLWEGNWKELLDNANMKKNEAQTQRDAISKGYEAAVAAKAS